MSLQTIVEACQELLINFPPAQATNIYANQRISQQAQQQFQLGYFPEHQYLSSIISIVGSEQLSSFGLLYEKVLQDDFSQSKVKFSTFEQHNLIIPYHDLYGNIIALVGRNLLDDEKRKALKISKYKNTVFHKSQHLFGLYQAKNSILRSNLAYVVEGQFDTIKAHDKGLHNIVALGSANMSCEQLALVLRYTDHLVLLLDNDDAGKMGEERILKYYGKYARIETKKLPEGFKDLCDFLEENEMKDLENALK